MDLIKALPATRPPFLILSPLCVLLGLTIVYFHGLAIDVWLACFTLLGAISAAIAVNTINEYQDFTSGLDLTTQKTPFSGGSGLLVDQPNLQQSVGKLAIVSTLVTIGVGCYLTWKSTMVLLPLGIIGIAIIVTYTRWLNKSPLLCYLAPGAGFALLMVVGTTLVQTQDFLLATPLISLIPAIAISNLLLVNQFPDKEADAAIGRNHLVVRYGYQMASSVFLMTTLLNITLLVVFILFDFLPISALIVLLPLSLSLMVYPALANRGSQLAANPKPMAMNVVATLATLILLSASLLLA